ncbi:MAG: hypothetical protein JJT96_08385 [Opitutales bacterium]|nr:hypothetical protein [Opitutales bacterium]
MIRPHPLPPEETVGGPLLVHLDGGTPVPVVPTASGFAVLLDASGPYALNLTYPDGWDGVVVRPARVGASLAEDGATLRISVPRPVPVMIETPGRPTVFVLAGPPAGEPPAPAGGQLLRFGAGKVQDVGTLQLRDGDVLWLDAGAWVRGHIVASKARGVRIGGRGVLDGSWKAPGGVPARPVILDHCRDVSLEGITLLRPQHWMVSIGACEDVRVEGIRQIGDGASTDGIDIVGSRRITVRGCFLRNGDDNIAIKALDIQRLANPCQFSFGEFDGDWTGPVEDVLVEGCAFYNDRGGTAMEIGYETRTDDIRNIVFRDIDVMAVHQFGSVFGIHNGDRARVENVLYEDIHVEHHYDKLVDFRVLHSRWNRDDQRGRIRHVVLRRIRVARSIYNEGYTVSLISGYDEKHPVEDIVFEDVQMNGQTVTSADALDLHTRHVRGIVFRHAEGKTT